MMLPLLAISTATILAAIAFPPVAGRLMLAVRPSAAVRVVVVSAVALSLGCGAGLTAIAYDYLFGSASVGGSGGVGRGTIGSVPAWMGITAAAVVVLLLASAAVQTLTVVRALVRSELLCRSFASDSPIVYVDEADIFTVAGLRGRVVIGTRLFDALGPEDRRVVTAHEWSHLRRRHHVYLHLIDIAAAANPFLLPVREQIRLGVERWADEDAVESVGDRHLVAGALARVALARHRMRSAGPLADGLPGVMAVASLAVSNRVRALMEPARPTRRVRELVVVVGALVVLVLGIVSLADVHESLEALEPIHRR